MIRIIEMIIQVRMEELRNHHYIELKCTIVPGIKLPFSDIFPLDLNLNRKFFFQE